MRRIIRLVPLAFIVGCGAESDVLVDYNATVEFAVQKFSGWSEPVNVGPGVNSAFQERSPALSPDKLSLYFQSDRPGGFGGGDLYVSRRDCLECPFGPAVNLGPNINTAGNDGTPQVLKDGKVLLYSRPMADGFEDILVSEREDKDDDLGWGPAKSLCSELNHQAGHFASQWLMEKPEKSGLNVYFSFRPTFANPLRIYRATVDEHHDRNSATFGTCSNMEPATELNQVAGTTNDDDVTIRKDGKEMFFWSGRPSSSGGDPTRLWTSTRKENDGPWSAPVPVGPPVDNLAAGELFPTLSWDARTLVFGAGRLRGGSGLNDIWIAERTPIDDEDH